MGDSSAMTIEFLRARLLAERSVSRTARQRADELAKRVVELEEQLTLVSFQRKKAEKATADVLAILENYGMTEYSEDFSSSSDEEATPCESKVGNRSIKDDNSGLCKNDADEFSGSEMESSRIQGRSLSWRSGNSPHSPVKKYMSSSSRRRSIISSTASASSKHAGKSCRRIRRRETRSAVEEFKNDSSLHSSEGIGVTGSDVSRMNYENHGVEDPALGTYAGPGNDKDMESALEHQAQLIRRYEEEEKAQRDWEEKFRENNGSTPDSCELGNQSDVTEERDESKALAPPCSSETISSHDIDANSKVGGVSFNKRSSGSHPSGSQPPLHVDTGSLQDKRSNIMQASESSASEFAFPLGKGTQIKESSESRIELPSPKSQLLPHSQNNFVNQSSDLIKYSHAESSLLSGGGRQNELALVPHNSSDNLGSVLEALQQAKLSLTHKINRAPVIKECSIRKSIEPSIPTMRAVDSVDGPVGYNGLFRVPTDFLSEAPSQANFPAPSSHVSSLNYHHDRRIAAPVGDGFMMNYRSDRRIPTTTGDGFMTSTFMEPTRVASADKRFLTVPANPYMESRSGYPAFKPSLEPHFDMGVPSHIKSSEAGFDVGTLSNQNISGPHLDMDLSSYRNYTSLAPNLDRGLLTSSRYNGPPYPYLMPSDGRISRPVFHGESAIPPANHYLPFNNSHVMPNTYN